MENKLTVGAPLVGALFFWIEFETGVFIKDIPTKLQAKPGINFFNSALNLNLQQLRLSNRILKRENHPSDYSAIYFL